MGLTRHGLEPYNAVFTSRFWFVTPCEDPIEIEIVERHPTDA
jgi:hypothetical protein